MTPSPLPTLAVALADAPPARVALLAGDPLRARRLARLLGIPSQVAAGAAHAASTAEVMVVDLRPGTALPDEARRFEGALLVLSDDPAVAADQAVPGVLPAAATERQLAAAVAALAEGLTVRTPALREQPGFAPAQPARRLLTPREVEVLAAVGQGYSNKTIARRLGISAHTVKYHLEAIYAKLDVGSRAEAVTRGLRLGVTIL